MSTRKPPFTAFEKQYLREILAPYIKILESKRKDGDFIRKKALIWNKVTATYNSSPLAKNVSSRQLKKLWLNMKARSKDAKSLVQETSHTDEEPYVPDMDSEHESEKSNDLLTAPHLTPTFIDVEIPPTKIPIKEELEPSIAPLDTQLIEDDLERKKIKFQKEMCLLDQQIENEKKIFDLKYKMLMLEYEHKKALFDIELKKAQH